MHSILMKIESDANQQAAKAAAEAELQVNIAALQRHVDDLKQQKKQLSDSCKQSCTIAQELSPDELLAKKLKQLCCMYRLIGVSVSSLGAEVSRIAFQTAHLGQAYDCYTVDVGLGGQVPFAVLRHDLPPFIPLTKIVDECVLAASKNIVECFIWTVFKYLHAYVCRRQEAAMLKDSINVSSLTASCAFDFIEFTLECSTPLVIQMLYTDLCQLLPSDVKLPQNDAVSLETGKSITEILMTNSLSESLPVLVRLLTPDVAT